MTLSAHEEEIARRGKAEAELAALRKEVSEAFDLPLTIGPAPGGMREWCAGAQSLIASLKADLAAANERAEKAIGALKSVESAHGGMESDTYRLILIGEIVRRARYALRPAAPQESALSQSEMGYCESRGLLGAQEYAPEPTLSEEKSMISPPPVCTGTGTLMADFAPAMASLPSVGLCGICGQRVPVFLHDFTLKAHPYHVNAAGSEQRLTVEIGEPKTLSFKERAEKAEAWLAMATDEMKAEREGTLDLRRRFGARDDETFPEFVERLATERERMKAEAEAEASEHESRANRWMVQAQHAEAELAAANERAERLEKALRGLIGYQGTWCSTEPDTPYGRAVAAAREALRPAAPEAKESDCTCGEQWPCPLHGGPPAAPEPTPSEERWPPTAHHAFVRSIRGPWCGQLADDGRGNCGLPETSHPHAERGNLMPPSPVGVPAAGSEQPDLPLKKDEQC